MTREERLKRIIRSIRRLGDDKEGFKEIEIAIAQRLREIPWERKIIKELKSENIWEQFLGEKTSD